MLRLVICLAAFAAVAYGGEWPCQYWADQLCDKVADACKCNGYDSVKILDESKNNEPLFYVKCGDSSSCCASQISSKQCGSSSNTDDSSSAEDTGGDTDGNSGGGGDSSSSGDYPSYKSVTCKDGTTLSPADCCGFINGCADGYSAYNKRVCPKYKSSCKAPTKCETAEDCGCDASLCSEVQGRKGASGCPSDFTETELKQMRAMALDETNVYRARHGSPPLKADATLDQSAQKWTEKLSFTSATLTHSKAPSADREGGVGENIAWSQHSAGFTTAPARLGTVTTAVDGWYLEFHCYDYNTKEMKSGCTYNYPWGQPVQMVGHFTALVWKSASTMGIGFAMTGNCKEVYGVAHYGPPGTGVNMIGDHDNNVPQCIKDCSP